MDISTEALVAISPIDGRYKANCHSLSNYFSEFALIKFRVEVEIKYLLYLAKEKVGFAGELRSEDEQPIRLIYQSFSMVDAQAIKVLEATTNHDVKAVEYFIRERLQDIGLQWLSEMVHFGLTSQDINNTAIPLSIKRFMAEEYLPQVNSLISLLRGLANANAAQPMLARTHGQAASPTTLGKELDVFAYRLAKVQARIAAMPIEGKFGGATGNFNAHVVAFPQVDWPTFATKFLKEELGLERQTLTTQIENYVTLGSLFDSCSRLNTILIDLCRDIWAYVSLDYFKQTVKEGEVGSSAMPHKVNPIDFENAEGNLGIAIALFNHFSNKLPISRLQRDLSDSTVLRNIGVPFAHTILAIKSIERGLGKLTTNGAKIDADLEANYIVIAEAIQSILRREGVPNGYEILKNATRGKGSFTAASMAEVIDQFPVSDLVRAEMKAITPANYIGVHGQ